MGNARTVLVGNIGQEERVQGCVPQVNKVAL
jgi:hypothetical protein